MSNTITYTPDNTSEVCDFIGPVPPCEICGGTGEYDTEYGVRGCNPCNSRLLPLIDFAGKSQMIDWGDTLVREADGIHIIRFED